MMRPARAYVQIGILLVELRGLEPLTPTLPVWCATSCAIAPCRAHRSYTTGNRPSKLLLRPGHVRLSRRPGFRVKGLRLERRPRLRRQDPAEGGDQQNHPADAEAPAESELLGDPTDRHGADDGAQIGEHLHRRHR